MRSCAPQVGKVSREHGKPTLGVHKAATVCDPTQGQEEKNCIFKTKKRYHEQVQCIKLLQLSARRDANCEHKLRSCPPHVSVFVSARWD